MTRQSRQVRCQLHEIAALRRALKDGAAILRKYSWGAMTGTLINSGLPLKSRHYCHRERRLHLPARLDHVRQLTDQGEYTTQLPDIGNFQFQLHPGNTVTFVGYCIYTA